MPDWAVAFQQGKEGQVWQRYLLCPRQAQKSQAMVFVSVVHQNTPVTPGIQFANTHNGRTQKESLFLKLNFP